jgi:hypothetical protein
MMLPCSNRTMQWSRSMASRNLRSDTVPNLGSEFLHDWRRQLWKLLQVFYFSCQKLRYVSGEWIRSSVPHHDGDEKWLCWYCVERHYRAIASSLSFFSNEIDQYFSNIWFKVYVRMVIRYVKVSHLYGYLVCIWAHWCNAASLRSVLENTRFLDFFSWPFSPPIGVSLAFSWVNLTSRLWSWSE